MIMEQHPAKLIDRDVEIAKRGNLDPRRTKLQRQRRMVAVGLHHGEEEWSAIAAVEKHDGRIRPDLAILVDVDIGVGGAARSAVQQIDRYLISVNERRR